MHKENNVFNLYYISYTLTFCYVVYYEVTYICIDGRFVEDCFCYHSEQIISAIANKYLIPFNLMKRAPETQNLSYCNTEFQPEPNQKMF